MARICENCGKKAVFGSSQKHKRGVAGKRWRNRVQATPRKFFPNLQKVTVTGGAEESQMRLCAKCIKKFKKDGKVKTFKRASTLGSLA